MPLIYAKNKVHIDNWRKNNADKKKELDNKHHKRYYCWKKIQKIYLNILLEN
jgi:hypothetical protein